MNAIVNAGIEKQTPAYDFFFNKLDDKQLSEIQVKNDTLPLFTDDYHVSTKDTIIVSTLDMGQLIRLRFIEQWQICKQTLSFNKRVIAVGPSSIEYDDNGSFRGFKLLFWLVFDESKLNDFIFE
jgi:hypothetical protein